MENTIKNKETITLIGCGILAKEIHFLIKKNRWDVKKQLFDSSLHVNFSKLKKKLGDSIEKNRTLRKVLFLGACHPLLNKIEREHKLFRTKGQNCVEILLGKKRFQQELAQGAFFLLEDWARRFSYITGMAFNESDSITREIFQMGHSHLLGIRTPCSDDFNQEAIAASRLVDLPLKWIDVDLDILESNLEMTLERTRGQ